MPLITPPTSLYVHLPWCVRKCPYCDFNSHALGDVLPERPYVKQCLADLDEDVLRYGTREVLSIFIGGGTPSLFSPQAIADLLQGIGQRLPLRPDCEVTLEANPGTVEQAKFEEFRDAGVNRLSIGIQSFADDQLQKLGRIHARREAVRAAENAHKAGFENFNLDLMFGLPEQSPAQAMSDLNNAIDLQPTHISWYQLTLEPNTLFHRYPPLLPDQDTLADIQEAGIARLAEQGYLRYEISAFTRAGHACRHNLNYWGFGDYYGIGAGAHGKLSDRIDNRILRSLKRKHPSDYLSQPPAQLCQSQQLVDTSQRPLEFMMNALRRIQGVPGEWFAQRTGLPLSIIEKQRQQVIELGLLRDDKNRLQASADGLLYLDSLLTTFYDDNQKTPQSTH